MASGDTIYSGTLNPFETSRKLSTHSIHTATLIGDVSQATWGMVMTIAVEDVSTDTSDNSIHMNKTYDITIKEH